MEIEDAMTGEPLSEPARLHTEVCAPCRTFLEERVALRQLVGSLEAVPAPPDFDFRLRARLAAATSAHKQRSARRGFAPSQSAIALAASFALIVAAAVAFKQMNSTRSDGMNRAEVARTEPAGERQPQPTAAKPPASITPGSTHVAVGTVGPQSDPLLISTIESGPQSNATSKGKKFGARRHAASFDSNNSRIMSADFVVYNAQPGLMQPGTSSLTVYPNPFVALSVRALTEPVKLLLDEGQGTMRPASLETVTFGSQNLVKPSPASASFNAAAQDVW